MLQILAAGTIFSIYNETLIAMMMAHGDSYRAMIYQSIRVAMLLGVMFVGGYFYGLSGLVYSITIAPALFYLALLVGMRKYNVSPKVELLSIAIILFIIIGTWQIVGWPGLTA